MVQLNMETRDDLDHMLDCLAETTALSELQQTVERLTDFLTVDHAVYHWVDSLGDHYHFGTYSEAWVDRYQKQEYVRVDPVVAGCYQSFHPVDWRRLDWTPRKVRAFFQDALAHGVGNQGYSIPIRGPSGQFAVFTVNANASDAAWDSFVAAHNRKLLLLAHFFNRKALEFEPGRLDLKDISLSPREVDALTLLAQGHSRAKVARTLSISEHTLRVYIESARYKLGAANTTHAIARATSIGLIVI